MMPPTWLNQVGLERAAGGANGGEGGDGDQVLALPPAAGSSLTLSKVDEEGFVEDPIAVNEEGEVAFEEIPEGPEGEEGEASGLKYLFSNETGKSDPGVGRFKLNHVNPEFATKLWLSSTELSGGNVGSWLIHWTDSSTPADRAQLLIRNTENPRAFIVLEITGTVVQVGPNIYYEFPIIERALDIPIFNEDECAVEFYRTGDRGAEGPQGKEGVQGKEGAVGKEGPQGKEGVQGKEGAVGKEGPQGKEGVQGKEGAVGKEGPPGPRVLAQTTEPIEFKSGATLTEAVETAEEAGAGEERTRIIKLRAIGTLAAAISQLIVKGGRTAATAFITAIAGQRERTIIDGNGASSFLQWAKRAATAPEAQNREIVKGSLAIEAATTEPAEVAYPGGEVGEPTTDVVVLAFGNFASGTAYARTYFGATVGTKGVKFKRSESGTAGRLYYILVVGK
jgi:hypothetical protein